MPINLTDLWPVAIHESGHGVCNWALGGTVRALNLCEDGGLARCYELYGFDRATMIAAGPAAEKLLANEPAPIVKADTAPTFRTMADASLTPFARAAGIKPKPLISDPRQLAEWAIERDDHPESWLPRVQLAHARAELIVRQQREKILEVARALLDRGELLKDDLDQLLPPIFPETKENAECQ